MHVEPQPVAYPMHVVSAIRLFLDESLYVALEKADIDQSLGDHCYRSVVRCVPWQSRCELLEGRFLCSENNVVDGALTPVEFASDGKGPGNV